jgi:hypothetical protein
LASPIFTTFNATRKRRKASGSKLSRGINTEYRLFSVLKCSNTNQGLAIELPNSRALTSLPATRCKSQELSGLSCKPAISGPFACRLKASQKLEPTNRVSSSLSQIPSGLSHAASKERTWTASRNNASLREGLGAR